MKAFLRYPLLAALLIGIGSGCTGPAKQHPLNPIPASEHPRFVDDQGYKGLRDAISQSLVYLNRIPEDRTFDCGPHQYTAGHLIRSLKSFSRFLESDPSPDALQTFIKKHYQVYKAAGREDGKVLFTGYFEPLLAGSREPSARFRYPVYGPPDDLTVVDLGKFSASLKGKKIIGRVAGDSFVPYFERSEIENQGALEGRAQKLAWIENPVALFFLHIQGSGQIRFEDGDFIHVHYHSKNGRAYRSIGTLLIQEDQISKEKMSMQAIRAYLRDHPETRDRILNHNASYIFFSVEEEGPLGAINVPLTPERSLAVDRSIFPLSALSFIQARKPVSQDNQTIEKWVDFSRFMLNQDTGGAIKGPGRADIFWGAGPYAELAAGHLKHQGAVYVLVLKPEKTEKE